MIRTTSVLLPLWLVSALPAPASGQYAGSTSTQTRSGTSTTYGSSGYGTSFGASGQGAPNANGLSTTPFPLYVPPPPTPLGSSRTPSRSRSGYPGQARIEEKRSQDTRSRRGISTTSRLAAEREAATAPVATYVGPGATANIDGLAPDPTVQLVPPAAPDAPVPAGGQAGPDSVPVDSGSTPEAPRPQAAPAPTFHVPVDNSHHTLLRTELLVSDGVTELLRSQRDARVAMGFRRLQESRETLDELSLAARLLGRSSLDPAAIERGIPVSRNELEPGDLLVFEFGDRGNTRHVGVYLGEGRFAYATSRGVRSADIDADRWASRVREARRLE